MESSTGNKTQRGVLDAQDFAGVLVWIDGKYVRRTFSYLQITRALSPEIILEAAARECALQVTAPDGIGESTRKDPI